MRSFAHLRNSLRFSPSSEDLACAIKAGNRWCKKSSYSGDVKNFRWSSMPTPSKFSTLRSWSSYDINFLMHSPPAGAAHPFVPSLSMMCSKPMRWE
jgi:hypothetical protein